jgi:hypothetical protein
MSGAASPLEGNDSAYQDQSRVVACPRSVILALRTAVLESFTSGPHGGAEVYGILFGTHGRNEVQIAAFQAIEFQSAMAGATPLSEPERQTFASALETARSSDPTGLEPVGWFRAHPHSDLTLTARDFEIAGAFFPAPHQVVMILRPSDSLSSLVRFFYREGAGELTADSPFCEFNVAPAFEAPPLEEGPGAREMQTGDAHSPGPATPVDETAAMYLPDSPPLPRRNLRMLWPLLVAIALGLLVAWYWLRPSEKLALRVFDSGGQLRIVWEPVSNGEVGNLEILDGSAQYSIALDPEQLRRGTFTYARRSESVSVRLEASRRGGGTIAETASFLGKNAAPVELNPPPVGSASRLAPPKRVEPEKPTEIVVSVPVTMPPVARPKFSAPEMRASRSTNQAPDLSAPPVIVQSAPASVPSPVETLSPPVERPAPPAVQPAGVPAQTAAAKPGVPPAAPRAASTPANGARASGRIIWIGRLQKNQELAINGKSCSTGTLIGELPGKPVKFSISPGDLSADGMVLYTANPQYANSVIESPGAQNGWNKTIYTWNPKYANDVTVRDAPAAQNQWSRLVLHSKNPKISVVVIDWSLVN